jgi:hypothetical protein
MRRKWLDFRRIRRIARRPLRSWFHSDEATGEKRRNPCPAAYEVRGDKIGSYTTASTGTNGRSPSTRIRPFSGSTLSPLWQASGAPSLRRPVLTSGPRSKIRGDRPRSKRCTTNKWSAGKNANTRSDLRPAGTRRTLLRTILRARPESALLPAIRVYCAILIPCTSSNSSACWASAQTEASVILNEIYWLGHIPDEDPRDEVACGSGKPWKPLIDAMDQPAIPASRQLPRYVSRRGASSENRPDVPKRRAHLDRWLRHSLAKLSETASPQKLLAGRKRCVSESLPANGGAGIPSAVSVQ